MMKIMKYNNKKKLNCSFIKIVKIYNSCKKFINGVKKIQKLCMKQEYMKIMI